MSKRLLFLTALLTGAQIKIIEQKKTKKTKILPANHANKR